MDQQGQQSVNRVKIVAVMIAALIIAGGIALLALYPMTDQTSFYIVVAAMVFSPIFILLAFLVNKRSQTQ